MEPGQTIYFPLDDYARASIHVSLSRLRREYRDLIGGDLLPAWSLDIPTPPGDLWAVTYHGLTEGGRIQHQKPTPQELRERRNATQFRYRARKRDAIAAHLMASGQADTRLREDTEPGFAQNLVEELRQQMADDAAAKAARKAELEARRKDPEYVPKPFVWSKSPAALEKAVERDRLQATKREQRAAVRAAKEEERQRRLLARSRPPTATEVKQALEKLEVSLAFYQERQEQLEAKLEAAEDSQAKAKSLEQLSPEQRAKALQGLVTPRWDRAQKRIDEYEARLKKYGEKIEAIEDEITRLKAA
jgi:predicted ATP-dependent endonuclease of OLD family